MENHNFDSKFESLLDYLRNARGFDFSGYKRNTLTRRVMKRMQMVGIGEFGDYIDFLEVHPEEFDQLFNTVLINVTSFFRDQPAWDALAREVIPRLPSGKSKDASVRVWCAGCASGEEAYSLAIILAEALGEKAFRQRVKIYATDVDEEALTQARQASYTEKDLHPIPAGLREKYFEQGQGRFLFRTDLRRSMIFGRNDLLKDAPISRLDLLVCRNTLMYFNAEAQSQILARFHFSLKEEGIIFLGKAEMLLTHSSLFVPIDSRHRLFAKVPKLFKQDRVPTMTHPKDSEAIDQLEQHRRLSEAAFQVSPDPQVIVDKKGNLVLANAQALSLFHLAAEDLGRPLRDLEFSYRPLDLRSLIDKVYADGLPVAVKEVKRLLPGGEFQYLDVRVIPLKENGRQPNGVNIIFQDVTEHKKIIEEYHRSRQELDTAYEELQSTNEELETTNEELQSTVEELQTTNEELQSTNEEMETMNEELQSTNEELETTNGELQQVTTEHNRLNSFLHSILASIRLGVVVLNKDLRVQLWNNQARELWGLLPDEAVGRPFLKLDIGLPVKKLKEPLLNFLQGSKNNLEIPVKAVNRRGKAIECQIRMAPIIGPKKERLGLVLLMEEKKNSDKRT